MRRVRHCVEICVCCFALKFLKVSLNLRGEVGEDMRLSKKVNAYLAKFQAGFNVELS